MNMTIHNLKVAVRNLSKYKLQATISVLSIAVGIVTLALVHAFTTWFSLPSICHQPHYGRTYSLRLLPPEAKTGMATDSTGRNLPSWIDIYPDIIRALKRDGGLRAAERIAMPNTMIHGNTMDFRLCDSTMRRFETVYHPIDPEYIPFIGMRSAITGRPIKRLRPGEAVISRLKASLVFGGANPVGAVCFDVNSVNPMPLTIVDVFEDVSLMEHTVGNNVMLFSLGEIEDAWQDTQDICLYYSRHLDIVLREGYTESQLKAELTERLAPFNHGISLEHVSEGIRFKTIINMQLFAHLAGGLILLVSIIGFLRMQVQLFWMRRREVSLRMINGAKRRQLFRLLFTEVSVVVAMAVATAVLLGIRTEDFISTRLADMVHQAEFSISGFTRYSLYIGGLLLLVCALVIWLALRRICNAGQGLAANMRGSRTHLFRNIMLGMQVTICIVFLCSTLTISHWGDKLMAQRHLPDDLTPYKESILVNLGKASTGREALKREIERLPSFGRMVEHDSWFVGIRDIEDNPEAKAAFRNQTHVPCFHASDTSLVEFMQCKVNWFRKPADNGTYLLLNEELYRKLRHLGLAANDMLTMNSYYSGPLPIAGTIASLPYNEQMACVLVSPDLADQCSEFVLIPGQGKYRRLVHEVDSLIRCMEPYMVEKIAKNFHESHPDVMIIETMRNVGWILATVSMLVCAMSIYSAIALDTRSRKKEMAIRKVNGAKSRDIYRLFGRLYFILVGISLLIALPVLTWLHDFFYREFFPKDTEGDGLTPILLFAAGSLTVITMIAAIVAWNIHNIMRTNPSEIIAKE